ncbi:MAG: TonB family protein [Ignavibacteriaceae bacterium]|nr:TonB family protein [Ignavibacteriaceae bacterium]
MKFIILLFLSFSSIGIFAQTDTVKTYFSNGNLEAAVVYEKDVRQGEAIFYWENGNVKEKRNYVNDKVFGTVSTYYENGNLKELFSIEDGKRDGPAAYYDSTGKVTDDVMFENGVRKGQEFLLVGEYREEDYQKLLAEWKARQEIKKKDIDDLNLPPVEENKASLEDDPAYYSNVEVMPEPIGGMNTIYKKLVYPKQAIENMIEGTVKVQVFIEKNGEVSSAEVVEGIGYGCDENARLSVYYTRFKPGLQKGVRMKVQMIIPIEFKLDKKFK